MDSLAVLLKPASFKVKKKGDPEQLFQDFVEYMELFQQFIPATNADGEHADDLVNCSACTKQKAMLILMGGKEVDTLFKHVGMVVKEDTFQQAIKKIKDGISKQTNQQCDNVKLQKKIIAEDLKFEDIVKYGIALEQGDKKVQ